MEAEAKKKLEAEAKAKTGCEGEGEGKEMKKLVAKYKAENEALRAQVQTATKFKDAYETEKRANLKKEATDWVGEMIVEGKILPKAKDQRISDYLRFKGEGKEALEVFVEDIQNRQGVELGEIDLGMAEVSGKVSLKSTDDWDREIRHVMALKNVDYDKAEELVAKRQKEMENGSGR
jgi:hypothetical protein